jgi:hypothetical protein
MATYFWVGGDGTWSNTDATNWSLTSGGAGGAAVPTAADIVTFNAASGTGQVTSDGTAVCLNMVTTGVTANTTFELSSGVSVYGNLGIVATATAANPGTNQFYMDATTTGKTVSIANTGMAGIVYYRGIGGGWTQSASTVYYYIQADAGTVTFSGAINCPSIYVQGGSLTTGAFTHTLGSATTGTLEGYVSATSGTLNISGSTLNIGVNVVGGINTFDVASGVTFTAGTSTITLGAVTNEATGQFYGGGKTYSTVNLYGVYSSITGANTFTNFNRTAPNIVTATGNLALSANQVCTGTFTLQGGNATVGRLNVYSDIRGTARTFTLSNAGVKTLKWVNLADITITNSGSALTPTLVGDCLGNTVPALTFPSAITCYAKTGATSFNYSAVGMWFTTSGGATSISTIAGRVCPLPHDNVQFDSNTGNSTVTLDMPILGANITFSSWAGTFSSSSFGSAIYGTLTNPGTKFDGMSSILIFATRTNTTLLPPTGVQGCVFSNPGATITLSSAYTNSVSFSFLSFVSGTFTTGNNNISVAMVMNGITNSLTSLYVVNLNQYCISAETTGANTLNLGSSLITLSGAQSSSSFSIWDTGSGQTLTVNSGTSKIKFTGTATVGDIFVAGSTNYYDIEFAQTAASVLGLRVSSCTFNSWSNSNTAPIQIQLQQLTTTTIATLSLQGSKGVGILISNNVGASVNTNLSSQATISLTNNATTNYVAYTGINKTGAGTLTANGVANLLNNTGITFPSLVKSIVYTGSVGANNSGSFVVPGEFAGSNAFIVVGGGGGAARLSATSFGGANGGGGGGLAVSSNLNISSFQTLYYSAGKGGAGATTSGTSGGNGDGSYINTSNAVPSSALTGAYATNGSGSTSSSRGSSGVGSVGTLLYQGGLGGFGSSGGGGGGTAPSLTYHAGLSGGQTNSQDGGAGGGGQKTGGSNTSGSTGGAGGQGLTGVAAAGGSLGNAGTAGTLGGGGGGGGGGSGATAAGVGGAAGSNDELFYNQLNGTFTGTTAIGSSGGGAGGGGNTTGVAGAGGSASYGGGGGGGGGGNSSANNGNGGNGGVGMVFFLYEYYPPLGQATFIG